MVNYNCQKERGKEERQKWKTTRGYKRDRKHSGNALKTKDRSQVQKGDNKAMAKTKTSTQVKDRYNKKTYDLIAVHVKKEIAQKFKAKCKKENITQASIIHNAIDEFLRD